MLLFQLSTFILLTIPLMIQAIQSPGRADAPVDLNDFHQDLDDSLLRDIARHALDAVMHILKSVLNEKNLRRVKHLLPFLSNGKLEGSDNFRTILLPQLNVPGPKRDESYAQCLQDVIVERLFNESGLPGFYVDLAANNPYLISNTYLLDRFHNWRGLCIEANPLYWYPLSLFRSCDLVGAAVGAKSERVAFNLDGVYGGIMGQNFDNKKGDQVIEASSVDLKKVFEATRVPKSIDYFSLDVEGAEYLIMESFPYSEYQFKVLTVERPGEKLTNLLKSNGYVFIQKLAKFDDQLWFHSDFLNSKFHGRLPDIEKYLGIQLGCKKVPSGI